MKRSRILPPLAGVIVERIFRESCRIYYAKIRRVRHCFLVAAAASCTRSIPRCRLADIVKPGPNKFTGYKIILNRIPPGLARGISPAYPVCIICRTLLIPVSSIVAGCIINTAAVAWRRCLSRNDFPVRMSIVYIRDCPHRIIHTCQTA